MTPIVPVILSGGAGTRLWPLSREAAPKPFMPLPDGETLLGKTARRAARVPGLARARDRHQPRLLLPHEGRLRGPRRRASRADAAYLLEPFGRNTAPAVALAALLVRARYGDDAVMLVLAADHLIRDEAAFARRGDARRGARARRARSSRSALRRRCRRPASATSSAARRSARARVRRRTPSWKSRRSPRRATSSPPARTSGTRACSRSRRPSFIAACERYAPGRGRRRARRVATAVGAAERCDARDRRRHVREHAGRLDRLRGHGKGRGRRTRGRRARRIRLERRRLVAGDLGALRRGRRRQPRQRRARAPSTPAARSFIPRTASSPRSASRISSSSTRPTRCSSRTAIICSA